MHTRKVLVRHLSAAEDRAAVWLKSLELDEANEPCVALRSLGLLMCERKLQWRGLMQTGVTPVRIPALRTLLRMSRSGLLRLMMKLAVAPPAADATTGMLRCSGLLGDLAISCARQADLTLVAAIVRAAGTMRVRDRALDEALMFLFAQQSQSGAFGLLAEEGSEPNLYEGRITASQLRATVDILSAGQVYADGLRSNGGGPALNSPCAS